MVTEPAATGVTTPVDELTVAIPVLLLAHVPPEAVSVKVTVEPVHIVAEPDIALAIEAGLTVITFVAYWVPQLLVNV